MAEPRWPHEPWHPGSAPQPAPQQSSPRRRRSRRTDTAATAGVVGGVTLLALGASGVGLIAWNSSTDRFAFPPSPPGSSQPESSPPGSSQSRAAVDTPTQSPTAPTPAGQPQARPVPKLGDNPLNQAGLRAAPTSCDLPDFDASSAGQQSFYEAALPCLNAAWEPALRSANLPFSAPDVVTVTSDVETLCGSRSPNETALYCDGTIYMTASYYRDVEGHGNTAGVYFGQLAHEYGHHVQKLAGIMNTSWQKRDDAGTDSPVGYETSRRFELQATCFGGMFLAAVDTPAAQRSAVVDEAITDSSQRGDRQDDDPEHGRPEHNATWLGRGYRHNSTDQCNTWLAEPTSVN